MNKTYRGIYIFIFLLIIRCNNLKIKDINQISSFKLKNKFENAIYNKRINSSLINWYKNFNDCNLNKIINKVIKNNLDIKIVLKRIKEAKYEQLKARSSIFPELNMSGDFNRKKQSYKLKDIFGRDINISNTSNTFSLSLMASYELDLWRKLSFQRKYATLEYLKARQNKEIILESMVSQASDLYFKLCAINSKIRYVNRQIKILEYLYNIYNKKFQAGLINYFQLRYYYNLLIDTKIKLKELLGEKKEIEQKLNLFMGDYPSSNNLRVSFLKIDINRLSPPSPLPSELLKRRPDIKLALLEVKSKLANLGYARALRFPSINLSANIGYLSDTLKELTDPESQIWGISSSILYPLFNAGKLKYNEKKYRESLKESILNYQKTVLNAFLEVESALARRKTLQNIYIDLKKQLNIKQREFFLEQKKYKRGLCSITDLYEKELDVINKKISLLDTKLSIIENQILLYKVLGGTIEENVVENIK